MRRFTAALGLALILPRGAWPAVLERVEVVDDGGPVVRLHVSEPVTPVAHALPAQGDLPARVYVDLPVATMQAAAAPRHGVGPLLRVRLGRFDAGTVRVVLDLATAMPFTVESGARTVSVRLGPASAKAEQPSPQAQPPPGPAAEATPGPPAPPVVAAPPPPPPAVASAPPPPVAVSPPPPAATAETPKPPDVEAEAPPEPSKAEPEPQAKSETAAIPPSKTAPTPAAVKAPRHAKTPVRPPAPSRASAAVGPPEPPRDAPTKADKSSMPTTETAVVEAPREPKARTPAPPPGPAEVTRPALPASRPPSTAKPLPLIIIDPGHGGHDPGAAGVGGIVEKDVVLDVARRLAVKLATRLPVSVVLTRLDDSFVPIERRVPEVAEAALFLSLHANACHDASAQGVEVFYGGGNGGLPGELVLANNDV